MEKGFFMMLEYHHSRLEHKLISNTLISVKASKYLHTTVCHGHGIVCRGITGELTVIGTGGRCKNVARVDKVRAGRVSSTVGPTKKPGKHLPTANVMSLQVMV